MKQHRPYCIQIELVFGCNLWCPMCGIHGSGLEKGEYYHMDLILAKNIAKQISRIWPKIRIEFAMCGEPTLHPNIDKILEIFRSNLPDAHLLFTTNGINFLNGKWVSNGWNKRLLPCNIIAVDCYEPYGLKLKEQLSSHPEGWEIKDYYTSGFNQHHYHHPKEGRFLVLIDDLLHRLDKKRKQRTLFNHAGNSKLIPELKSPLMKKCTFPFREMVVRYNGVINICCLDFGSEMDMGKVDDGLDTIWYGDNFNLIRGFLYHKLRVFSPCLVCDMPGGFRMGILPKYPKPQISDLVSLKSVHSNSQKYNHKAFRSTESWKGGLGLCD